MAGIQNIPPETGRLRLLFIHHPHGFFFLSLEHTNLLPLLLL
jgi:hypothetical protein